MRDRREEESDAILFQLKTYLQKRTHRFCGCQFPDVEMWCCTRILCTKLLLRIDRHIRHILLVFTNPYASIIV